jgi:cellulose synthase/poly-beta-1,6-N-acetylglucosamine synthase-like glycosyltransferase
MTLPIWFAMMQWRPALPLNGKPKVRGYVPTVDVAICTYKEDINDVVDTIVAAQRVEYQAEKLHVYLLDDGRRPTMEAACAELAGSGLLRYPLTYVNRPTNEGYKGGNINHFFEKYKADAGEFFIILDADMQPFPDMMDIFMGHFFGLSEEEQERVAFIQTPQWYRNFNKAHGWTDFFFISEFFFYRILQPANSFRGCAVYCGCCGLWSRRAIDSVGGFTEGFATEDSVTGCKVIRNKVPGKEYNWISKFVSQPVAVGVSPDTLPALMAQRLRWYHGMMQMFEYHNYYLFADGLEPVQKLMFWVGCAGWIVNLVNYAATMTGTLLSLGSISYFAFTKQLQSIEIWAFWIGPAFLVIMFLIFTLNPGCTWIQYFHTMSTVFMYTPVYVAAALKHYFKMNIKVQATAVDDAGKVTRWCPFYILPVISVSVVILAASVTTVALVMSTESNAVILAFHVPIWIGYWLFVHNHALLAMMGYVYTADVWYEQEAEAELCNPAIRQNLDRHRVQGGLTVRDVMDVDDADQDANDPRYVAMYNKLFQGDEEGAAIAVKEAASTPTVIDRDTTVGRLNLQIARRIAINQAIEATYTEASATPRFDRAFLGRAANHTYRNEKLEMARVQNMQLTANKESNQTRREKFAADLRKAALSPRAAAAALLLPKGGNSPSSDAAAFTSPRGTQPTGSKPPSTAWPSPQATKKGDLGDLDHRLVK